MKKYLLSLAAVVAAFSASASPFSVADRMKPHPENVSDFRPFEAAGIIRNESTVASRAGESVDEIYYTLAGEPYSATTFNNATAGMQIAMAFQFEPSFLAGLDDCEITGISYYTGVHYTDGDNKITKATVFIASALDGTYLYTQDTTAPNTAFTKVNVTLDTPFKIPADTKIYAGVFFTVPDEDSLPIVFDYQDHSNSRGGNVGSRANPLSKWTWQNASSQLGFMCVGATIQSPNFPKNSVALVAVDGQPVAYQNEGFGFDFMVRNDGANAIDNITLEYGIDGESTSTETVNITNDWGYNQSLIFSVPDFVAQNPTKGSEITVKVTKINGADNTSDNPSASYSVVIVPAGKGLPRNVVIEEFTSTSCVYCPVGYTSMEMIHDEFTDGSIIPVCVHVNSPGADAMRALSFNSLWTRYSSGGVPNAVVNRYLVQYPFYDDLITTASQIAALPGLAQVTADATLDKETRTVTVNSKTSFAFDYTDGDKNFILAYAVTENEVGPYTQQNGYAGQSQPVFGGWNEKPSTVSLVYNDVARQLDSYTGITGSVPAEIVAGESYEYSHDIKLVTAIKDLDKINVIVYLINRTNKQVENACMLKAADLATSGIESAIVDNSDAPVEYYNLQGVRVNNPANGVYIRRQGSDVSKVLVK